MTGLKLSFTFLLIVVVMGAAAGLAGNAFAQGITIETSADRFFGEGVLHVLVTDPNAKDDNAVEELLVNIAADPESGSSSTESFLVPETTASSGRFELFIVHVDANEVAPDELDPINSAGVEGDGMCVMECAPLVTFGPGGIINVQSDLYDEVGFEINTGNEEAEVRYEETPGSLELDRDSYGTTSFVYISVIDQDANLNPRDNDEFTVDPDNGPNDDLLGLGGGTFEEVITFTETGDNTGVFEGKYRLSVSILADSESLALTLHEKANYGATLAASENDSNNIDEISFTVGNSDGTVDVGGGQSTTPTWDPEIETDKDAYLPGNSVHVTVTDQDANVNSGRADSIKMLITSGQNSIEISALETDANTGVFEASFVLAEGTEGAIAPGGSLTITYADERPADYSDKVHAGQNPEKDFAIEVDIQHPIVTGIDSTRVSAPVPVDVTGGGGSLSVGNSVTLSTTISNNNEQPQPFVAIIEIRDSEGVTVYLALQGGTLEPTGSTVIGILWQPEIAGTYELRTFAITEVSGEAELLSPPAVGEIVISAQ